MGLIVFAVSVSLARIMSEGGEMSVRTMLEPLLEIFLSLALGCAMGVALCVAMRFFHSKDNFLCISIMGVLLGVGLADLWGLSSLLLCMA